MPVTRVRDSEAFKRQEVSELEDGRQCRTYGIGGTFTVARWVRRYGTEDFLPGDVRVETLKERDELREAQPRVGGLKLHSMLREKLESEEVYLGRDLFFEVLRNQALLLETLPKAPRTTNSRHGLPVFRDLVKEPELSGLKQEYFLNHEFRTVTQARRAVDENVYLYNTRRPHRSLNLNTPEQAHGMAA